MDRLKYKLGLAIGLLFTITGCGGSAVGASPKDNLPAPFSIELQESSYFAGGSLEAISLTTTNESGKLISDVHIENAENLKGMFFDLHYDAASWHPVVASPTVLLAPTDSFLHLAVLDDPGVVHFGEAILNPDTKTGFSGSGMVVRVEFAAGTPPKPKPKKEASTSPPPQIGLGWWSADTLHWKYCNPGDYDLNGEVNLADIVQIAIHFQERITVDSLRNIKLVDGDGNGEINLADLAVIAQYHGNSEIEGYDLYSCLNENDLPENNDGANGSGALFEANIPFSQMLSEFPEDILPQNPHQNFLNLLPDFLGTVPVVNPERQYWVRPVASISTVGLASTASSYEEFSTAEYFSNDPAMVSNQELTQLTIYYKNGGDADQDSVVLLRDVFEYHKLLEIHYGSGGPWPLDSLSYLADGDGNAEVNLADLSVAVVNQKNSVARYSVFAANELDTFNIDKTLVADIPFSSALGNPETERIRFEVDIAGLDWQYYQAEAYTYNGEEKGKSEIIYVGE